MTEQRNADEAVIDRVLAGDTEAFGLLVDRHGARLLGAVLRMVGNRDTADDLSQETLVKAYTALSGFRRGSSFYTWLYAIAVNLVRSEFRRRGTRKGARKESLDVGPDEGGVAEPVHAGPGPADEAARHEDAARVHEELQHLDEEFRVALVLRDLEGLSYEEVAAATGVPVGTVRSRIHRGRAALKERLLAARRER